MSHSHPNSHRTGCPCCSPYLWGDRRLRDPRLSRRGFFGAGAALTAAALSVLGGTKSNAAGFSALAFAAPKLGMGETRRSRAEAAGATVYRGGTIRTMNGAMPVGSLGEYPCAIGSINRVFSVELAGIEPATPCLQS